MKVFAFLTRLATLDQAAFARHWRHPHGTLTRRIPQILRYVQNHLVDDGALDGLKTGGWSGIAAIWLRDAAAMAAAAQDPNWAELDADGDAMYDRSKLGWLMTRETIIREGPRDESARPAKAMMFLKAGAGPFDEQAVLALAVEAERWLPRMVDLRLSLAIEEAPLFDAVLECGFDDGAALAAAWGRGPDLLRELGGMIDLAESRGFVACEERVIWPEPALAEESAR